MNSTAANMLMPWQASKCWIRGTEKLFEEASAKEFVLFPEASVASLFIFSIQSHSKLQKAKCIADLSLVFRRSVCLSKGIYKWVLFNLKSKARDLRLEKAKGRFESVSLP